MSDKAYLAIDMGASSGRHVDRTFRWPEAAAGRGLPLRKRPGRTGRAPVLGPAGTVDLRAPGAARPQPPRKAAAPIVSVGVDTWGVDFGLLGCRNDELLGNPYHYRDSRTNGMLERAFSIVPREEIFRHTGLQFMQFNTLYQLLAMKLATRRCWTSPRRLADARPLPLAADRREVQRDDRRQHIAVLQSRERRLGHRAAGAASACRRDILGRIVQPGTKLGPLRAGVAAETGLAGRGGAAGHPRHGQRRDGRSRPQQPRPNGPIGATSAWAPGP